MAWYNYIMPIHRNINRDFFKEWSPNMAYVVGFFAADGYMTLNKRGGCFWNIQITDKELLEIIKEIIGAEHKIGKRFRKGNERPLYRLQIGSKEMFNDLINLGFKQGKTKSLAVPQVPAKYFRDFVRGYFDGDGNIWMGYVHKDRGNPTLTMRTCFTSCSLAFLLELKRRIRLHMIFKGNITRRKANCFALYYSVKDSLKFYNFMYNHPKVAPNKDIYLGRKKEVFERYLTKQCARSLAG